MADEQDFPTAIIPSRPAPTAVRFDKLAEQFGDPMVTLFALQCDVMGHGPEMQLKAAAELMPYRYPKLRAQEIGINAQGANNVNIQINIGAGPPARDPLPPAPPAVDPLD